MTNYQKRKEKNDEYRSKIMRFTFQLSLGDGEVRDWFEQQPEKGAYLKKLILRDKAEQLGYGEQKAPKQRKVGDYEIMQEIRMGGRVLLMGFHPMDETYMTCYEQYNFLGETIYPEAVASKDYLEIANTFIERLQMQLEKVKEFRAARNQATTDQEQLARLLGASDTQMSYVDNAPAGHGLIKVGGAIVPFANELPKNTELYRLMTTKPGED